jgi:ribosomal protein L37E
MGIYDYICDTSKDNSKDNLLKEHTKKVIQILKSEDIKYTYINGKFVIINERYKNYEYFDTDYEYFDTNYKKINVDTDNEKSDDTDNEKSDDTDNEKSDGTDNEKFDDNFINNYIKNLDEVFVTDPKYEYPIPGRYQSNTIMYELLKRKSNVKNPSNELLNRLQNYMPENDTIIIKGTVYIKCNSCGVNPYVFEKTIKCNSCGFNNGNSHRIDDNMRVNKELTKVYTIEIDNFMELFGKEKDVISLIHKTANNN